MEVESMLSETPPLGVFVRSTGWYFKTSGFALRCVNSLSSLLSDHLTQFFFLLCFQGHHCANSNFLSQSVCPCFRFVATWLLLLFTEVLIFSSFLPDCHPLFNSTVQAIITLHLLLSLEDSFSPGVEEEEVETGSGGPKGFQFLNVRIWVLEP